MKPLSTKRQAVECQMLKAYAEIQSERGPFCEESGATNFEHSHNYPRNPFIWLIPVAENITLLSREKHLNFENNELWLLPNSGPRIMRQMMAMILEEEDNDRRKLMRSHYVRKMYSMQEQAKNQDIELPAWCQTLLNEIGI